MAISTTMGSLGKLTPFTETSDHMLSIDSGAVVIEENWSLRYFYTVHPHRSSKMLPTLQRSTAVSAWSTPTDHFHFHPNTMVTIPTSLKIYYANFPFWRGDCIKAALYLHDIPFENITDVEKRNELKQAGKSPFGTFPVIEVDGKFLSQTQACAAYVGKLTNMYPSNDDILAQANCDEIINGCTDITVLFVATFRVEDKKAAREKLIDPNEGKLHLYFKGLDSIVCRDGSEFACGKECGLTVADLAIWRLCHWFYSGTIDHVPVSYVQSFSNLKKIYDNVESNEKIKEFKNKYYPDKN